MMKRNPIVCACLLLGLIVSACSGQVTPSSMPEEPPAETGPVLTTTLAQLDPTAAAEATAEPSPTASVEPEDQTLESTPTLQPTTMVSFDGFLLGEVGFSTPESVLYDPDADLYLVANINGGPSNQDGNGFISQVSPSGEIIELKWIDGNTEGVTLNAPKGMVLTAAGLYVADIDHVRLFDRVTGESIASFPVNGATFLNDLSADQAGLVYVSDSGAGGIYEISPDGQVRDVVPSGGLQGPNGLAVWDEKLYVTSGTGIHLVEQGNLTQVFSVPQGSLDGLVFLDNDQVLVSSWQASAVFLAGRDGSAIEVVNEVPAPADIGFDPTRGYILIPQFNDDQLDVRPLP
ncbi:MAG: hypothetical protein P1S60_16955 [Anaerolineae bacterium]|nr:hypothetical protein [Anaerolineae bacterium]